MHLVRALHADLLHGPSWELHEVLLRIAPGLKGAPYVSMSMLSLKCASRANLTCVLSHGPLLELHPVSLVREHHTPWV